MTNASQSKKKTSAAIQKNKNNKPMKTSYVSPELTVAVIPIHTVIAASTTTDDFSIDPIEDGGEF